MDYNRVIFLGNATRDVESKMLPSGTAVANFGIAVNAKYGEKEEVCFIDITCFSKLADLVGQYVQKGGRVLIDGRLTWRTWEDKEGNKRAKHEVIADRVLFLGRNGENNHEVGERREATTAPSKAYAGGSHDTQLEEGDIPF